MVVEPAGDDLVGRLDDERGLTLVELAECAVGQGRRFLDEAEGADDGRWEPVVADPEIFERALGLCASVPVGGNLDGAHGVAFKPKLHRRAPFRWGAGRITGFEVVFKPPRTGITALGGDFSASKEQSPRLSSRVR